MRPPRPEGWYAEDLDELAEAPRSVPHFYTPEETVPVAEVVSPESAHRDRTVKLRKYAEAGIANYWRIEDEDGSPVVHADELDAPTRSYVPTGIHRHELRTTTPFAIALDLDGLVPGPRS